LVWSCPVDAAIVRLLALAARAVPPQRLAREVDLITSDLRRAPEAGPEEMQGWLDELLGQISAGVDDAEEQLADVDRSEPAAVTQAQATLHALRATRDAAQRALAARCD
jgi:hypothetical protein